MGKVKLTKPQIEVLRDLSLGSSTYSESYAPIKNLLKRGFAAEKVGRFSTSYIITDLGRSALAEEGRGT